MRAKIFDTVCYEKLAELLGVSRDREEFEFRLIRFFESENAAFDRVRFIKAVLKAKATKFGTDSFGDHVSQQKTKAIRNDEGKIVGHEYY